MSEILIGGIIGKGKTKDILETPYNQTFVVMRNRDEITKNDRPDQTEILPGKGKNATTTTTETFALLRAAGIPTAFHERLSDTDILVKRCRMINLEVIARRYAEGSYLKRYPHLKSPAGEPPYRFHRLKFELFLKTSGGKILDKDGNLIGRTPRRHSDGKKRPVDDPLIADPYADYWGLRMPKIPGWDKNVRLGVDVNSAAILPEGVTVSKIEELTRKTFLVLEGAWAQLGCRLVDFKIEFGMTRNNELVVADVIDNDSWRLRTWDWKEVSKQLFRDNADRQLIADKYALVADLVSRFRIPRQALVYWRGSVDDPNLEPRDIPGIEFRSIIKSGHKSPMVCCEMLERLMAEYPEGGVIIDLVGKSNGLGPTLSARTRWPVISIPADAKERPHNVWSHLECPSRVPLLTVLSQSNALQAAFNILSLTNPIVYMANQYMLEELEG